MFDKHEKCTILVAGGSGFIGSNFIHILIKKFPNLSIVNYDDLRIYGNLGNHSKSEKCPRYHFIKGDVCDESTLDDVFNEFNIEGIVNFAVEYPSGVPEANPRSFFKTNVEGTATLLQVGQKYSIKRFLQVSAADVYGSLEEDQSASEETPLSPDSMFGVSKVAGDMLVKLHHQKHGLNSVISRSSSIYGPYQFPHKLIPFMFHTAKKNKGLPVHGDGLYTRDWLNVTDHCEALWEIFDQGEAGEVYNMGGGKPLTNNEVIKSILAYLGKPDSLMESEIQHPQCDQRHCMDFSKIKTTLQWEPKITFDEGIVRTLGWYYNNQDWMYSIVSGEYRTLYDKMA